MKKVLGLILILSLTACQLTANENSTKSEAKIEPIKIEKSIPVLPNAGSYDGFIIYFKKDIDAKSVLLELEKKQGTKIIIERDYPEENKYVVKLDLPRATDEKTEVDNQKKNQALWSAMNNHQSVKIVEPNLMMTITN